jgi:hypothetical protein
MTRVPTARGAGHLLVRLLVPQIAAGAWLALVPDGAFFRVTQAMTVVHVATSLVTLPLLVWIAVRHAHAMLPLLRGWARRVPVVALVLSLGAALVSGVLALGRGEGTGVSAFHLASSALVVVPLLVHLVQGRQRAVAWRVGLGVAIAGAALATVGRLGPRDAPAPPPFEYTTRAEGLYDPAHWCGECHTAIYAEWHRSAHSRTLGIREVRGELHKHEHLTQLDLASFGAIAHAAPDDARQGKIDGAFPFETCASCHSPTSFYGDDPRPILDSEPPARDGVTCSFCHTLRDVRPAGDMEREVANGRGHPTAAPIIQQMPLYVSAPETVRRYLGQGSANGTLRWLGNALIRWRPEVHRRDYHVAFLDHSRACSACHGGAGNAADLPVRSYVDWEHGPYAPGGSATQAGQPVDCQDCHMTTELTARPVRSPGQLVDWGPVRPQRRTHLFLGGNVRAALEYRDGDMAAREHDVGTAGISLRVRAEKRDDGGPVVVAQAVVRNERAGHLFPTVDSNLRFAWVSIRVVDAKGKTLASTATPREGSFQENPTTLFRCLDVDFGKHCDSAIPPLSERTVRVTLPVPAGEPAGVTAEVFHAFDPAAIAAASTSLP